jgi:hypothetical protein
MEAKKMNKEELLPKMKQEAIERMKLLQLHTNTIKEFRDDLKLNRSDRQRVGNVEVGTLYWLNEKEMELVGDWQKETGNLVYHVIHSFTEFGELYDCLYVSQHPEEWDDDRLDIRQGQTIAHCINVNAPECSESGYIGIKKAFGGLIRVW